MPDDRDYVDVPGRTFTENQVCDFVKIAYETGVQEGRSRQGARYGPNLEDGLANLLLKLGISKLEFRKPGDDEKL